MQCAGGTGKCVDLDGSRGNAGIFTSKTFSLSAGSYVLSFDVSGNQRNHSDDTMELMLGGYVLDTLKLSAKAPWQTITYAFDVTTASSDYISFNHLGGDNIGIMLDNVSVTKSVSEPATFALLGLGLAGLAAARRKK